MAIRNLKATWVFLSQVGAFLKLFLRDLQMSGCVWGVGAMGLDLKGLLEQIDFTPLHVSTEKCSRYGCLIQKERSHDLYTGKIDIYEESCLMEKLTNLYTATARAMRPKRTCDFLGLTA